MIKDRFDVTRTGIRSTGILAMFFIIANLSGCTSTTKPAPAPAGTASASPSVNRERPVDLVYPYLDTANSRWFYFDSASRPFGMVNLSPDTELGGALGSGYRYNSPEIKGFSHVHAWQLAGLSVMPVASTEDLATLKGDYFSPFDHGREKVRPGYHQVYLDRYGINAELTATTRVGFHRYRYTGREKPRQILLRLGGQLGPVTLTGTRLQRIDARTLSGFVTNGATIRRPKQTPVFFHIELNTDIENLSTWTGGEITENATGLQSTSGETTAAAKTGEATATKKADTGALVTLAPGALPVLMKVGISYVSAAKARANMESELAHWNFDKVVADADREWNQWLSKIAVEGGTRQQRRRFYTDLWHALQGRRIISDADGEYSDQTGTERTIRQIPVNGDGEPAFNHHNSDSFWGAQWTINTLWPLSYPKLASDFGNSLVQYYKDGGLIPRGPSGGNYTFVMTGASSTPFIVSNWMKGIRDFDIDSAYEGLRKNHLPGGIMGRAGYEHKSDNGGGIGHYIEKGYVPFPLPKRDAGEGFHRRGAGQTLEYAFQDHTLSQLAATLGKTADAELFAARALNYRNLYDLETGFMRPREDDGSWRQAFDPYVYQDGFVESNAAQMTWFVPHDIPGLAALMGGNRQLLTRLDQAFTAAAELGFTSGSAHAQETDDRYSRIPINYGNQPSMQTAFIFSAAGAPWKTQYWSREVVNRVYAGLAPDTGYNGDEDQGLMGSLAVLMKIGLFQLSGGTEPDPIYWIGSPLFDRINIQLDSNYYEGESFVIETRNNSDKNRYIQSLRLNGAAIDRTYLRHSEITAGGRLILEMGPEPVTTINAIPPTKNKEA